MSKTEFDLYFKASDDLCRQADYRKTLEDILLEIHRRLAGTEHFGLLQEGWPQTSAAASIPIT